MSRVIDSESFAKVLMKDLENYSIDICEKAKKICNEESKKVLNDIKRDSPVDMRKYTSERERKKGDYKRGWRRKKTFESETAVTYKIYNLTNPHLTHLLEKGHATRSGSRYSGKPHVRPNEQIAVRETENRIKEVIKNE